MQRTLRCTVCSNEQGEHDVIYTEKNTDIEIGCSQCIDNHDSVPWLQDKVDAYAENKKEYWDEAV